jgi:hypothetical protein
VSDSKFTWFFTRDGNVTIKLPDVELIHVEPIVYPTTPRSPGLIVLTTKRIVGLGLVGNKRWELGAPEHGFQGGGGAVTLPDGDVVIYNFGHISDSGVELIRIHPLEGNVVYRVNVDGLGVAHSQYLHSAFVRARGSILDVVSIGSSGTFVETRNASDGKLIGKRWQPNGKMLKPEPSTR